ncbi:uncharacterized protein METZ01_LOCUS320277, partial [marine metagenome]
MEPFWEKMDFLTTSKILGIALSIDSLIFTPAAKGWPPPPKVFAI